MRSLGDLYYGGYDDSGAIPGYSGGTGIVGPSSYTITTQQFSFGGVLKDFGDWIVTTAGETLKTVIDAFGRRIVEKTGEVLAPTPIGQATVAASATMLSLTNPLLWVGGAVIFVLLLGKRR